MCDLDVSDLAVGCGKIMLPSLVVRTGLGEEVENGEAVRNRS